MGSEMCIRDSTLLVIASYSSIPLTVTSTIVGIGMKVCQSYMHQDLIEFIYSTGCTFVRYGVGIGMTAVTLLCQSYMHQGIIQLEYSTGCTYVRYDESMMTSR